MKLILRADVDNLGRLGEVVAVKPGYGRNYLVPQGLAMPFTAANQKVFESERKKLQAKMDTIKAEANSLKDKIDAVSLAIPVRVGDGEKLYGSVTAVNIAEALAAKGVVVDRKKIEMTGAIRALGEYVIEIKLHPDVRAEIKVAVVKHDAGSAKQEAQE